MVVVIDDDLIDKCPQAVWATLNNLARMCSAIYSGESKPS